MINVKTDKKVKEQAQKVARELGLPLSTVINSYLRDFIKQRAIYISAAAPARMTPALERLLQVVEGDIKKGKNLSPIFSSSDEMDEYLDAS